MWAEDGWERQDGLGTRTGTHRGMQGRIETHLFVNTNTAISNVELTNVGLIYLNILRSSVVLSDQHFLLMSIVVWALSRIQ